MMHAGATEKRTGERAKKKRKAEETGDKEESCEQVGERDGRAQQESARMKPCVTIARTCVLRA